MPALFPVYQRQTDAAILVHLHRAAASPKTYRSASTRQDHYRKFQSLALMHCHDPDYIFVLADGLGFAHGQVILLHGVDIGKEAVQTCIVALFERGRFFHQHPQVGDPLFAYRQAAAVIIVSRLIQ